MGKKKKRHNKQKQNVPNLDGGVKKEIEDLQNRRGQIDEKAKKMKEGKGFLGRLGVGVKAGLAKLNYNREINSRRNFLRQGTQLKQVRRQTELEKAKSELAKAREKNKSVNFNSIKVDDIFGI